MARTREEWLTEAAIQMATWFADLGCTLPKVRMSIGFPSKGARGKAIGECWSFEASADATHEIFIRPDRHDTVEVAAILAHELAHAAVGIDKGHGPEFRRVAVAIGLKGKMTATTAGDGFLDRFAPIHRALGDIPHAELRLGRSSGPKKQTTRLVKACCAECGYTVRLARKWIDEVGAPHCPAHGAMVADLGDDAGDGGGE